MIIETLMQDDLIERHSDQNVYIKNTVTGHEYESAIDKTNEWRVANGYIEYMYTETDNPIIMEEQENGQLV